jgi:hypothetical protein
MILEVIARIVQKIDTVIIVLITVYRVVLYSVLIGTISYWINLGTASYQSLRAAEKPPSIQNQVLN